MRGWALIALGLILLAHAALGGSVPDRCERTADPFMCRAAQD